MDGSLNIEYHIKRLLIIAQAKYRSKRKQQKALGISHTRLMNLKKKYKI